MMYIFIPKNQTGTESHYWGKEDKENLIEFELTEDEYYVLYRHHVFDILNSRYDLWIDNGESETVTAEQLKESYKEISLVKGTWLEAVDAAIKYNTCAFLDF